MLLLSVPLNGHLKGEGSCDEADRSLPPNYYGHLALDAKVAKIPFYSLIPGKEVRNLVLGVTRDASTMCFVCSRSGDGSAPGNTQCVLRHRRPWGLNWNVSKPMGAVE
ncbi:hypothetical protein TNCV_2647971 [Trichonephila clavipes]|nr:hypothetical protein TNCV_2647971 [Trichonephila clavipes]